MHLGRVKPLTVFPKQPPRSLSFRVFLSPSILLSSVSACTLLSPFTPPSKSPPLPSSLQSHLLCLAFFSPFWLSLICHLNLFFLLCASFSHFLGSWEHLGAFHWGSLFAFEDGCDLGCLLRRLFSSWWTLCFPASTSRYCLNVVFLFELLNRRIKDHLIRAKC